jgi:hypothetical protein
MLRDVMVGAGRPSMASSAILAKSVDGRHSPAMTDWGDGAPTAAVVLARARSGTFALFAVVFVLAATAAACAPIPCPSGYADPDWCKHIAVNSGG